jgi:hypothetical protein
MPLSAWRYSVERGSVPDYVSITVAARNVGKTTESIKRLLRQGKLRGIKVGNTWAVLAEAVPDIGLEVRRRPKTKKEVSDGETLDKFFG